MWQKEGDLQKDRLTEAHISASLNTRWLGRPVHYYPTINSTNVTLAQLAEGGAPSGTMVITDFQSQGKGRLNRRWEAPAQSSLLFSVLFRPAWPAEQTTWLTMIAGLAALTAIEAVTALSAGLKWPNDVMLKTKDGWRKAGGLLLETKLDGDRLAQAILGIGLNVNIPAADLPEGHTPASSLLAASGHPVPRRPLLASLLATMEHLYEAATRQQSPQPAWNKRLITRGQRVIVRSNDRLLEGIAFDTDAWGQLLVRDETAKIHTIAAGDVTLRGASE